MTGRTETPAQLDRAIDRILGEPAPASLAGEGELTAVARALRDSLPRFHPRFGFDEHLVRRLSGLGRPAAGVAPLRAERPGPSPVRLRPVTSAAEHDLAGDPPSGTDRRRRGLVAGGAIASGVSLAIPLAGAAIVVWRRSRSHGGLL